jgi:hypothetical protein
VLRLLLPLKQQSLPKSISWHLPREQANSYTERPMPKSSKSLLPSHQKPTNSPQKEEFKGIVYCVFNKLELLIFVTKS